MFHCNVNLLDIKCDGGFIHITESDEVNLHLQVGIASEVGERVDRSYFSVTHETSRYLISHAPSIFMSVIGSFEKALP